MAIRVILSAMVDNQLNSQLDVQMERWEGCLRCDRPLEWDFCHLTEICDGPGVTHHVLTRVA
jgi:hypothetical protein